MPAEFFRCDFEMRYGRQTPVRVEARRTEPTGVSDSLSPPRGERVEERGQPLALRRLCLAPFIPPFLPAAEARNSIEPLSMNRRAKEPLFLTFSPQAGRRNQRPSAVLRFWASMRQFFGGNLSPASPRIFHRKAYRGQERGESEKMSRPLRLAHIVYTTTTVFSKTPTPVISIRTTSPSCRVNPSGGTTPVPVNNTAPCGNSWLRNR